MEERAGRPFLSPLYDPPIAAPTPRGALGLGTAAAVVLLAAACGGGGRHAGTTAATTVHATRALVARGKLLYEEDACSGCHSLDGTTGAGPTWKGLAGSKVTLANGQTVTADAGYLTRSIVDPNAQIVKGFHGGIMPPAILGFGLASKPADVRALVAFIESAG